MDPRTIQPSAEAMRLAGASRTAPTTPPALPPPTSRAAEQPAGGAIAPALRSEDAQAIQAMPEADRAAMIRTMVERLAQRLKENPNDREGWLRLARAYDVLGEKEKANAARARAGEAK